MKLRYTRRARRHLDGISQYITERNPDAARQVGARIREVIELLGVYPNIGREGAMAGTRELVVPGLPYIVVHRIDGGDDPAVTILGIYHGAQLRPGQAAR
jgi:plasmid stabilization system protein ParE